MQGLRSLGSGIENTAGTILFSLRLPRTILIAMVGAALAGSGTAYQGLFRNPLADPYLIGVASGAGLGAVAAMSIHWSYTTLGLLAVPLAAFASGLITVAIVYALARVGHALPASNLILSGVAVSSFATALTSFLMLRASGELRRALAWLLGGATMSGWQPVLALLPYWVVGLGILLTFGHALNVLQFGDEQAQQLGLPVNAGAALDHRGGLAHHGGGCLLCRHHWLCRADHPAHFAPADRAGLPPPAAAVLDRRGGAAVGR